MTLFKNENLWDVYSLYEFQYFNCPACKYKTNSKQEFIDHAFDEHPDSNEYLKKIQDGSIRDIACPWWTNRKSRKRKIIDDRTKDNPYAKVYRANKIQQPVFENKEEANDDIFCDDDFNIFSESNTNQDAADDENTTNKFNPDTAITKHQCLGCKKYFSSKKSLQNHNDFKHCLALLPQNETMEDEDSDKNDNYKTDQELFEDLVNDTKQNEKLHVPLSPLKLNKYVCKKCNDICFSSIKALQNHNENVHGGKSGNCKCAKCGKVYSESTILKEHIKTVHEGFRYKCEENECEKEFTSKSGLIVHIRSAHGGVRYNCDQCEKNFQIPHGLKAHKAVSHNENKYKCQKCEKVMKSASAFRKHMHGIHKEGAELKCPQCEEKFGTGTFLKEHIQKVHEGGYSCDQCEKSYSSKVLLKNHIAIVHEGKTFNCDKCEKKFTKKTRLNMHLKTVHEGNGEKNFHCDQCPKTFYEDIHLKKHIKHCHERIVGIFPCDECEKKFTSKGNLIRHVENVHRRLRAVQCELCGKGFEDNKAMKEHKNAVHLGLRIKCEKCERDFSHPSGLHKHLKRDHEGVKIICPYCQKNVSDLKIHILNHHEQENKINCDHCDKTFASVPHLNRHISVVHFGIKPYKCEKCGQSFENEIKLKYHDEFVHQGIKKNVCTQCGKGFMAPNKLRRHIDVVHNKIPEDKKACDICGKVIVARSLKRHFRKAHQGAEVVTEVKIVPRTVEEEKNVIYFKSEEGGDVIVEDMSYVFIKN